VTKPQAQAAKFQQPCIIVAATHSALGESVLTSSFVPCIVEGPVHDGCLDMSVQSCFNPPFRTANLKLEVYQVEHFSVPVEMGIRADLQGARTTLEVGHDADLRTSWGSDC